MNKESKETLSKLMENPEIREVFVDLFADIVDRNTWKIVVNDGPGVYEKQRSKHNSIGCGNEELTPIEYYL